MKKLNFLFMGTPDFGIPSINYLLEKGFDCLAVVTQPDRAKGRGYQKVFSPVKQLALEKGIPVLQPDNVNTDEFFQVLKKMNPDVIVVAAFGQILKKPLLDLPALGCINLHASLLPKYRGAAPIQWAIANGEKETGITVQHMALKVDSGAVITQTGLPIEPDETAADLFKKLAEAGGPALEEAMTLLAKHGRAIGQPQDESQATFAPRLSKSSGDIDWSMPAVQIHDLVRAFNPWPGTTTVAQGTKLKILSTKLAEIALPGETDPGTIVEANDKEGWLVAAGQQSALWILNVQCPNSKKMAAQAYTCGYRVGVGDRLGY